MDRALSQRKQQFGDMRNVLNAFKLYFDFQHRLHAIVHIHFNGPDPLIIPNDTGLCQLFTFPSQIPNRACIRIQDFLLIVHLNATWFAVPAT